MASADLINVRPKICMPQNGWMAGSNPWCGVRQFPPWWTVTCSRGTTLTSHCAANTVHPAIAQGPIDEELGVACGTENSYFGILPLFFAVLLPGHKRHALKDIAMAPC